MERIVRVVEITPLPKAPQIVVGVINVHGIVIPVFNIRKRFNLPDREIELSDQLIIANSKNRKVALLVDSSPGIEELPADAIISSDKILPSMEYLQGVIKLEDEILFIHNLDEFLSLQEDRLLDEALKQDPEDSP